MRVGSVVYATAQGLGYLAKSFYDAGVVTDVVVVRHGKREEQPWYPGAPRVNDLSRDYNTVYDLVDKVDVMLYFETPFVWSSIEYARSKGVPTVLMPMYECAPERLPYVPDRFLCPSLLDLRYYPHRSEFIPVPVESCFKWRKRTKAEVFVHNAGHGGLKGRNGTSEVCLSLRYVKSNAKLIVRSQTNQAVVYHPRCNYLGSVDRESLYNEGDVFLFPEKFNGLSLPLQEAYASGMLVMTTDRFPNNTYLPVEPMIPVSNYVKNRIGGCNEFDEAVVDPRAIAAKIDEWYGRDISAFSEQGRAWGEEHSWERLKPRYTEYLERVVAG